MADSDVLVAQGDWFGLGADSYTNPQKVSDGEYVMGMNVLCRGGLVQTRPGSRSLFTMPQGNLQGATFFKPANGVGQIVFAVNGKVYASPYPFTQYTQLKNIQFNPTSRFVAWATCVKSTDFDEEGIIYTLPRPYSVLIMQDGATRAAYWDGTSNGHLNPTHSPNPETSAPGYDETVLGLWMFWSNNRLWVSRGNQIFASDYGNPMKFTEAQFLNEARAFYIPGICTGMIETSDQQGILCFTDSTGTFFNSSIQDRTQWLQTPNFYKTVLPNVGCVAPRSTVNQYGMSWWYSAKGLISLDDALRINITSRLVVQDNEMFFSKFNLSYDLSSVCGSSFENILFQGVPNGDKYNTQIMVLDQAPFEQSNTASWAGFWTGWRPVEFCRGVVSGAERLFVASADFDGNNRMWSLMESDKTDNGVPITCFMATKEHAFETMDFKQFHYAEVDLREVSGDVSFMAAVSGIKGGYQRICTKEIVATVGQVYADKVYGYQANILAGSRPQIRDLKTSMEIQANECNEVCIETEHYGFVDKAFSMLLVWSGIAGIASYRMFSQPYQNVYSGRCETNEVGPKLLTEEGCGSETLFSTAEPFSEFSSTKSFTAKGPTGLVVSYTATQVSIISQQDADRKALIAATNYVLSQIGQL